MLVKKTSTYSNRHVYSPIFIALDKKYFTAEKEKKLHTHTEAEDIETFNSNYIHILNPFSHKKKKDVLTKKQIG